MTLFGYATVVLAAALAIAGIGMKACDASARQPEIAGRVFTVFILGAAFCEALALLGFVLAIMGA